MELLFTGRHVKVSEDLREYVRSKIARLNKHFDGVHKVEVMLDREGDGFKAELVVHAVRGVNLFAEASGASETAALDVALDRMDRQVVKMKDRLKDRRGTPGSGEVSGSSV